MSNILKLLFGVFTVMLLLVIAIKGFLTPAGWWPSSLEFWVYAFLVIITTRVAMSGAQDEKGKMNTFLAIRSGIFFALLANAAGYAIFTFGG